MEEKLEGMKLNITIFNKKNKKLNEYNKIEENIKDNIIKKQVLEGKYEKKEKDIIRAFKLLKAKYDVKKNKYANFNMDDKNNLVELDKLDIENSEKIYTWSKLPEEDKELLIDKVVNIERIKNSLNEETCVELKDLLLKNGRNVVYNKHEKVILGYNNLLYIVGDNNKKKYIFNNMKMTLMLKKLSKKVYKFI